MSYASRLVQMSRPVAAVAAPVTPPIAEVHDEVEAPPQAQSAPVPSQSRTAPAMRTHERIVQTIDRRVERETVEDAPAPQPNVVVVDAAEAPREPVRAPAPWHAEDPAGDPLEKVEAPDDIRSLLRAVRAWTAAPPTPIEPDRSAPIELTNVTIAEPAPAVIAKREEVSRETSRDDSLQVSIGNVMITVEDAPAPRGASRPQPPRIGETASRLARHYLRGR